LQVEQAPRRQEYPLTILTLSFRISFSNQVLVGKFSIHFNVHFFFPYREFLLEFFSSSSILLFCRFKLAH